MLLIIQLDHPFVGNKTKIFIFLKNAVLLKPSDPGKYVISVSQIWQNMTSATWSVAAGLFVDCTKSSFTDSWEFISNVRMSEIVYVL